MMHLPPYLNPQNLFVLDKIDFFRVLWQKQASDIMRNKWNK